MILAASLFNTPIDFFNSEEVPTILVKIKNGMVEHQLPNWSGDTWTSYGSWSSYLNTAYVKNRTEGATVGSYTYPKHCVLIHESDDTNVPVGTKYGSACPADIVAKTCPENATIVNGLCECDTGFELVKGICQPDNSTSGRSDGSITQMNYGDSDDSDDTDDDGADDDDDDDADDGEENNTLKYIGFGGAALLGLIVLAKLS